MYAAKCHAELRHPQAADADSGDESDGYGEAGLSWEAVMAAVRGTDAADAPRGSDNGAGDVSLSEDKVVEPAGAPRAVLIYLRSSMSELPSRQRYLASACYGVPFAVSVAGFVCCPDLWHGSCV